MRTHEFPNKLTVLCLPRPEFDTVNLATWIRKGASHDPVGKRGTSHLAEHLFFSREVTYRGERINPWVMTEEAGGTVDAATYRDMTRYQARVHKANWREYLHLLLFLLQSDDVSDEQVEAEKNVIETEIREYMEYPDIWANVLSDQMLFEEGTPLGRFVGGSAEDLPNIAKEDVLAHWQQVHGGQVVIQVMGDVTLEEVIDEVAPFAPAIPAPAEEAEEMPLQATGFGVKQVPGSEELVTLGLSIAMPSIRSEKYFAAELLKGLMTSGTISRLVRKLRREQGLIYDLESDYEALQSQGLWNIVTSCAAEDAPQMVEHLCSGIAEAATSGFEEAELEKMKRYLELNLLLRSESANDTFKWLGRMLARGRLMDMREYVQAIHQVTAKQVNDLAREVFAEGNLAFGLMGGDEALAELLHAGIWKCS